MIRDRLTRRCLAQKRAAKRETQAWRLENAKVERDMRRRGEPPFMAQVGQGPNGKYFELWYPREELVRTFGEEEVSRFVEIDGKLYRPGTEPPEPPAS